MFHPEEFLWLGVAKQIAHVKVNAAECQALSAGDQRKVKLLAWTDPLEYEAGKTLYGRAKRQLLVGRDAWEAEERGYLPYTYQAVKWFVIFFFPVVPLGTYTVMRKKTKFLSLESPQYLLARTNTDWKQILGHYLVAYGPIVVIAVAVVLFSRLG